MRTRCKGRDAPAGCLFRPPIPSGIAPPLLPPQIGRVSGRRPSLSHAAGTGRASVLPATRTAVLGPTNTGKTHLAVERMCGHQSGMIGFPLRLLAREVYDRVAALKGAAAVALITGEEKIVPEGARYFCCTVEAMPADREVSFVAIDEIQTAADPERGHVFTDRLLHMRGYAETMLLGSETMRPLVRKLLPDFEIVTRPRFSTLSYAGTKKLSRLPRRSAIVAFTAADVYALAEMLRRQKGGAAVVMGSLSPRTRNAQVAMYQSGEVDYLVATDAIGMGLNMDIAHVAFASLSKFDGHRHRRLRVPEMAQIAGRAGRYQKDGSFGTVQLGAAEGAVVFTTDEIDGIEGHRFEPLSQIVWRNTDLDFGSLPKLLAALDARPGRGELVRGDDAIDFAVLKRLAGEPWVMERAHGPRGLGRLWAACGLPDYRKTGEEQHARLVGRVFRHLSEGDGTLPEAWIASELAHLDRVTGDVPTLADRIAAARTWTYVAHRPGWLADGAHWAERTRAVEDRLSDALHLALTQRFVDRRTAVLLRGLKAKGGGEQRVAIDADGTVAVEGEAIGTLTGFRFTADPQARAGEQRMLLAAAEKHLPRELAHRARELASDADGAFAFEYHGGMPPRIQWRGARVALLRRGRDAMSPRIELDRSLAVLAADDRTRVLERLQAWFAAALAHELGPLVRLSLLAGSSPLLGKGTSLLQRRGGGGAASRDVDLRETSARALASLPREGEVPLPRSGEDQESPRERKGLSAPARGLVVRLVETLGALRREEADAQLALLTRADRQALKAAGGRIGPVHLYVPALLRPEPTRWRLALWAVWAGIPDLPPPPVAGRVCVEASDTLPPGFLDIAGYWRIGGEAVRIDIVDRLALAVHNRRQGRAAFVPDPQWAASAGLSREGFARLMRALGYRLQLVDGAPHFAWRGHRRVSTQPGRARGQTPVPSPFSILAGLKG